MSCIPEDMMIGALRDFIRSLGADEETRHFDPSDTRLALAALLVHAITVDGAASAEEQAKLRDLLARGLGVSGEDLDLLIADATAAEREAVDLYRFTSVLKRRLGEAERIRVVESLWEMAFADGRSHEFEENLIWRVAELLGVNRSDRIAMKSRVAENKLSRGDHDG
jgi:uncharacterized tellurite resistance protein B-like protein